MNALIKITLARRARKNPLPALIALLLVFGSSMLLGANPALAGRSITAVNNFTVWNAPDGDSNMGLWSPATYDAIDQQGDWVRLTNPNGGYAPWASESQMTQPPPKQVTYTSHSKYLSPGGQVTVGDGTSVRFTEWPKDRDLPYVYEGPYLITTIWDTSYIQSAGEWTASSKRGWGTISCTWQYAPVTDDNPKGYLDSCTASWVTRN